ncbi:MAG: ADOP family duplicated permease [Gemmatimonadota bacterium]
MSAFSGLRRRLGALLNPGRAERELDAEIALHIEFETAKHVAEGVPADEARRRALVAFGGVALTRERHHDGRRVRWVVDLWSDLRFAVRGLRREPAFTLFVVAVFALGIGANATMFGVVDRLLLRGPEHVYAPDRLVEMYSLRQNARGEERASNYFGYASLEGVRREAKSFDGLAAFADVSVVIGTGTEVQPAIASYATANYFPLLGVQPLRGRFFTSAEDATEGAEHVVVVGDTYWQSELGGTTDVLNRSIIINDESYRVVGVAPHGFTGVTLGHADLWLPMSLLGARTTKGWTTTWTAQWLQIVGRLAPGVTREQASEDATRAHRLAYTGPGKAIANGRIAMVPLGADAHGEAPSEVAVARWLAAVALVVLLIACSNVINLLLARIVRRRPEVAIRTALGAGRSRLVRLFLVEGSLLAVLGGIAALGVASLSAQLVRQTLLPEISWPASPLNGRVLLFDALLSLGLGVLVSLLPAVRASRADLASAMKGKGRAGGEGGTRVRALLTVAQTALSVLLLIGAGLFLRSLARIRAIDLGIQPERVVVMPLNWGGLGKYPIGPARDAEVARRLSASEALASQVRQIPGVQMASVAVGLPFGADFKVFLRIPGRDTLTIEQLPSLSAVSPGYFETVGTPMLRGRPFGPGDRAGSERVAIVSALMAKMLWRGADPIGECIVIGADSIPCARVVGIAADTHRDALIESPSMHYYIPLGQESGFGGAALLARASGDPAGLVPPVRNAVLTAAPDLRFAKASTLQQIIDPQSRSWRLGATVFGMLGGLALLVASIGLYSLVAYFVSDRKHEIGIRLALGAPRERIVGLVVGSSIRLVVLGVVVGCAVAVVAGKFIEPLLYGVRALDPVTFGAVALVMLGVAGCAALLPASRAARIDPLAALREE